MIANTEPVIDSLTLTPEEAFVDDELLCEVTVSDADNDDVTAVFTWENLTTGDTYPSTTTSDLNALWTQVPYQFNQKTSLNVLFPLRMNLVDWMVIL